MNTETVDGPQFVAPYTQRLHSSIIENCLRGQAKWDAVRDSADVVCAAGHDFIGTVTRLLLHLPHPEGSPLDSHCSILDHLRRGMTDSNSLMSLVPLMGGYTAYLWILRHFVRMGDASWMTDWDVSIELPFSNNHMAFPFDVAKCAGQDLALMEADIDALEPKEALSAEDWHKHLLPFFLAVEFHWLHLFVWLSSEIEEPELDLIPAFFFAQQGETAFEIQSIKDHPLWKDRRSEFEALLAYRPFRLSIRTAGNGLPYIHAKSRGGILCHRLIDYMESYEHAITNQFLDPVSRMWRTLRAGDALEDTEIDEALRSRLRVQSRVWPRELIRDKKLRATAVLVDYLPGIPAEEARSDPFSRLLRKTFNEAKGICRGKGRSQPDLDEAAQDYIRSIVGDLVQIHEIRPNRRDYAAVTELQATGRLEFIAQLHIETCRRKYPATGINVKDRDDLTVKLVQVVLQEEGIGAKPYRLEDIAQFLKKIL